METILEEWVDRISQEVAEFSPDRGRKEMRKVGERQPELVSFMVEFTEDSDREVKELVLYMFFNVYRMFQKAYKKEIKTISFEEITTCYDDNENLIKNMEGVHDKFYDRIARVQLSKQPYVMKYVLDTLFEGPEEDPIELTDDDIGHIFLLLKTVIDLLNIATDK